jgi:hypothetical protein
MGESRKEVNTRIWVRNSVPGSVQRRCFEIKWVLWLEVPNDLLRKIAVVSSCWVVLMRFDVVDEKILWKEIC